MGLFKTRIMLYNRSNIVTINEEISSKIQEIERGVTGIYGKGMYTEIEKLVLICATPRKDVSKVRKIAKEVDENSFIIIMIQIVLIFSLVAIITFFIMLNDTIKIEKRIARYTINGSRTKFDKSYFDMIADSYRMFVKRQRRYRGFG